MEREIFTRASSVRREVIAKRLERPDPASGPHLQSQRRRTPSDVEVRHFAPRFHRAAGEEFPLRTQRRGSNLTTKRNRTLRQYGSENKVGYSKGTDVDTQAKRFVRRVGADRCVPRGIPRGSFNRGRGLLVSCEKRLRWDSTGYLVASRILSERFAARLNGNLDGGNSNSCATLFGAPRFCGRFFCLNRNAFLNFYRTRYDAKKE